MTTGAGAHNVLVPSGASVGNSAVHELRDRLAAEYCRNSVYQAVKNAEGVMGLDLIQQWLHVGNDLSKI
ncbi:hypothetical protein BJX64DRAFT_265469 [Aspergillus heterothallicus]